MKSLFNPIMLLLLVSIPVSLVHAAEKLDEAADIKALKLALVTKIPQASDAQVSATPISGLYQVLSEGQIMYTTKEARYILDGDMFDMKTRKNLTENTRGGIRLKALNKLGEENMLVYTPEGKVKRSITVFTDIYCPYCRQLHNEMDDYMKNGIKVRYIFVPFKGQKSVDTSVSVWCAKDRTKALDLAKSGEPVEKKTCDNPISKHRAVAAELGIRGTPAIMMDTGELIPGYVPSKKVISKLSGTL